MWKSTHYSRAAIAENYEESWEQTIITLLQRYVKEWEAFVNVDNIDQVKNRDTLTVARVPTLPNVTAPPGGLSLLASTTEQSQTELAHTKVRTIALALVI